MQSNKSSLLEQYREDETRVLAQLLDYSRLTAVELEAIKTRAKKLIYELRTSSLGKAGIDKFLVEYHLASEEGVALMCLAEAMLRVPDKRTIDKLIQDKIEPINWQEHLGKSNSTFVNAATWGLVLTGKVLRGDKTNQFYLTRVINKLIQKSGEPFIRSAILYAMKALGNQFILGQNIDSALKHNSWYSFDMLGEEALTATDAKIYFERYKEAIEKIAKYCQSNDVYQNNGVSVKLSALFSRYDWRQKERVMNELYPKVQELAIAAKHANINFTIDAEEAERLMLSLDLFEKLALDPALCDWQGLGLAVQAYQKRAFYVLDFIIDIAKRAKRQIMVRLVKGAYWDTELKISQEKGLCGYPVFTRKSATDVSFIACAKKMLGAPEQIYCQFATHNAYTVATIFELAKDYRQKYEFQRLHGMGEALYENIENCRIYAPVGNYVDLLPYLARRLLENGANSSFVNRLVDDKVTVDELIIDPGEYMNSLENKSHPKIPLPKYIYGKDRLNSAGIDFTNDLECESILEYVSNFKWQPTDKVNTDSKVIAEVIDRAHKATFKWKNTSVFDRTRILYKMADLLEENKAHLMALIVREGGRSIVDSLSEVREAIDFCRYYALRAEIDCPEQELAGPVGEYNQLSLHGRGVIACISPWNFPLAIFLGQVVAALVAGNTVIAKPASQTPTIAAKAIELLHLAGSPKDVVQLLVGSGATVGNALVTDLRIAGIMFTGSYDTARDINQKLAARQGPITPFIAETGGQNVMLIDSTAQPEQVVKDIIMSAFNSAGQRCSALRVLYLQEDIADKMISMLTGAMAELKLGDPAYLATDIGPVIDKSAYQGLQEHFVKMQSEAKLLFAVNAPEYLQDNKPFFGPCAFEIKCISELEGEVFGPILHIVRYNAKDLDKVLDKINATGFGLTLGIHSRVQDTIDYILERAHAGNIYVNRNMVGAVVGVQPFGGEGLSGTGPKAGGPHYIPRLTNERALSVNTAAVGGNVTVMSLQE